MSFAAIPVPRGLIVSCQAYEGEPLFGSAIMVAMARAAIEGGAVGIRANSPPDIEAIRQITTLPIIGLFKVHHHESPVYITPDGAAAAAVAAAGSDIIAIDATGRPRANGTTLAQLIEYIHTVLHKPVMADISCVADAQLAEEYGAEVLSTTLSGYTAHGRPAIDGPDFELLETLVDRHTLPVIAEGRYHEPWQVARAFELGAHAVVVGGAITRPQDITRRFARVVPNVSNA